MVYKYIFDAENCLYKEVCSLYQSDSCNPSCSRFMEMDFLLKNSGIPTNRQRIISLVPDKRDREAFILLRDIKNDMVNFVKNGENLYIFGKKYGNGKTTWSIKCMMAYFNQIWAGNGFRVRGLFIHVPSFLTKIKQIIGEPDAEFEEMRSRICDVDLVIWDDIAASKLSDYDHTILLSYIDQRVLKGLANIYTGNLSEESLIDSIGNRLKSRVWNLSTVIELVGEDRRGIKL